MRVSQIDPVGMLLEAKAAVMRASAKHLGVGQVPGAVAIDARHRLPLDVVGEMVAVLAEEPPLLVCDLTGLAPVGCEALVADLRPVSAYLDQWPGTLVVLHTPDDSVHACLSAAQIGALVLVSDSWIPAMTRAMAVLPTVSCQRTYLSPVPEAAAEARAFVAEVLRSWELGHVVDPAVLVVSELVTNAHLHARTVLDLSVSRIADRVRVAVGDRGGGNPAQRSGLIPDLELNGRGLLLVRDAALAWGVLPGRRVGKTVWVVLDGAGPASGCSPAI